MKVIRLFVSCVLLLSLLISPLQVSAETMEQSNGIFYEMEVPHPNGGNVVVAVPSSAERIITEQEIQALIAEKGISAGEKITFWRVGKSSDNSNLKTDSWAIDSFRNTRGLNYSYKTEKEIIRTYTIYEAKLTSCARGMSTTLESEYVKTFDLSLEGEVPFIKSQIGSSYTGRVSVTYVFNGPPEDSPYNSRSFYIRFYAREMQWKQHEYLNGVLRKTVSGNACETYDSDIYSVDKYIRPGI